PVVATGARSQFQPTLAVRRGIDPQARSTRCEFPRNTSSDYATTWVKRGASIGANATIVCGVTLHECAFVAAEW
ncbi:MAG: hypothetical protein ACRC8Y_15550, partial [Chroococcales cyanobacterium]